MPDVSLSTQEFKALSSESRTRILKILDERNHTLSELSARLEMAAPTVKQHTSVLVGSGLVELMDEGRKWKYYTLTKKGRQLLHANETKSSVFILLSSAIVVGLVGFAMIFMLGGLGSMPSPGYQATKGYGVGSGSQDSFYATGVSETSKELKTRNQMDVENAPLTAAVPQQAGKCVGINEKADDYNAESDLDCANAIGEAECTAIRSNDEALEPKCKWQQQ